MKGTIVNTLLYRNNLFNQLKDESRKDVNAMPSNQFLKARPQQKENNDIKPLEIDQAHEDMLGKFIIPNIVLHEQLHYDSNYC